MRKIEKNQVSGVKKQLAFSRNTMYISPMYLKESQMAQNFQWKPSLFQDTAAEQRLEQKQILHAKQLHSLEYLTVPIMALKEKVIQELNENPIVELDSPDFEEIAEPAELRSEDTINEDRDDFRESMEKMLVSGSDSWNAADSADAGEKHQFLMDSIASRGPSLQDILMDQLKQTSCSPAVRRAAEQVIGSIDGSGYLLTADGDIAQAAECSLENAEKARLLVQTFEPSGIAARDLRECLLIQLRQKGQENTLLGRLVKFHLQDIARNKLPRIAKELNISLDEVKELIGKVRTLNPRPASGYDDSAGIQEAFIQPEVFIVPDGEEFKVVPAKNTMPKFHIAKRYMDMLSDPAVSAEDKKYIQEKLRSANELKDILEQRGSTIQNIAEQLVKSQHEYFAEGPASLRPMTQKELADKIDREESTVSRAVAGKYLQTPRGLVPFSDFFTGGFTSESGDDVSSAKIKEIICGAIKEENPAKPLSDSRIEKILSGAGFHVARRTIAKYREELGIAASHLRKKFQ